MYEYIPNKIIEGTIRAIANVSINIYFFINDFFKEANYYYFNEDDSEEIDEISEDIKNTNTNTEYLGWEFEIIHFFTEVYSYFFGENPPSELVLNDNRKQQKNIQYVDKYKDEWKTKVKTSKSIEELDVASLKNNILIETTPFGNVIMYYDHVKTSFVYYCDKTLSYPVVNTVGRKYVLRFCCEKLYLDEDEKASTSEDSAPTPAPAPTSAPSTIPVNKNVYAKFKKHDKQKKNASQLSVNQKEEPINRYTCEGKLSNFSFLKKVAKVKPFSYKDFKNSMSKNKSSTE